MNWKKIEESFVEFLHKNGLEWSREEVSFFYGYILIIESIIPEDFYTRKLQLKIPKSGSPSAFNEKMSRFSISQSFKANGHQPLLISPRKWYYKIFSKSLELTVKGTISKRLYNQFRTELEKHPDLSFSIKRAANSKTEVYAKIQTQYLPESLSSFENLKNLFNSLVDETGT
jgi:hypothetical protein